MLRKISRILPNNCVFLECDIQEKLRKHIKECETVIHNAVRLGKTAHLFNIPIITTEQIPKNFGETVLELQQIYKDRQNVFKHIKSDFSMLEKPVLDHLEKLNKKNVVLYGMESHICVKQTALTLLEMDYSVTIVVDAISSMNYHDRTVGIEAMRDAGAIITTYQSLVFELSRNPLIPEYKELLALIKDMPKEHIHLHQNKL